MRGIVFSAGLGLVALGCGGDLTSGMPSPTTSHGVSITASVGSRGASGDSVTIHIANAGADTAYVPRCGSQPLLLTQQFVKNVWTGGVQNFMCLAPSEPGPVVVPPGGSLDVVRVFQAGRYRMSASVSGKPDLSDAVITLSDAFDAP